MIHENKFAKDFSKKVDLFNSFFGKRCSVIENNSVLPWSNQYLSTIEFTKDDIKRIICKFDPSKTHSHDTISVHKLKMYGGAIFLPLFTIFKNYLKCEIFPDDWNKRKGNTVFIFKKDD